MDGELNLTYITLYGYVEMGNYRYLIFLNMFIVYVLSVSFNIIILYLIWIHQNLHEPMYIFIAALLLNSVVTSTTVYPKLLIDILSEKQVITFSACVLQCFIYYSVSASDFLLLAAMAYDRYVSICKPLQYTTIMTKNMVSIILGVAWVLPACQIAVSMIMSANKKLCNFTLKAIFCNNSYYNLFCVATLAQSIVDMVTLFSVAVLPILFILFTYTRILIISYRSGRNVRKKAAQTCSPHLIILISFSSLCLYDVLIIRLDAESYLHFIMTLQAFLYYPLFNPVVYGLKVKEIYKHLKKLICPAKMI
uniref:olfactory receptor 6N2-like n=1 Tax=Epinephelus lanceolatus TaxID=310571 RepID=UPI001447C5D6|nr:olfactory receptor 6N2-like [Epinephelus lanceolatus]XP_033474173.1 olfactory receptor 6N2-like [Epinephelus lanceolatus]